MKIKLTVEVVKRTNKTPVTGTTDVDNSNNDKIPEYKFSTVTPQMCREHDKVKLSI